jgi:predicted nucleic acid-binding protein
MTVRGITLDTGALIAIERRKQRGNHLLELAKMRLAVLSVPVPVVAEWWRGRTETRGKILDVVNVAAISLAVVKAAGEALARVDESTVVDAMVMAFAASRGDVVFTEDVDDLERLRAFFPSVKVLACGTAS